MKKLKLLLFFMVCSIISIGQTWTNFEDGESMSSVRGKLNTGMTWMYSHISISGKTTGQLIYYDAVAGIWDTIPAAYGYYDKATSRMVYQGIDLGSSTAVRLLSTDASNTLVSTDLNSWIAGTVNEIEITDDADGTVTIGLPILTILPDGTTATTQSAKDNSTKAGTTAYSDNAIDAVTATLELDFTNISQMKVILGDDTVVESGGHEHTQYFQKTGGDISGDITATGTIEALNLQADLLLKIGTDFKIIIFHDTMCGVKISTTDTVRIVPIR